MAGFSRAGATVHSLETKWDGEREITAHGAFALDATVTFRIRVPSGTETAEMILFADDGTGVRTLALTQSGTQHFSLSLPMRQVAGEAGSGLFFYQYRVSGAFGVFETRHAESDDALSYVDAGQGRPDFQLLVYEERDCPPAWLYGGTVYQIFPDRFFEGDPRGKEDLVAEKGGVLCRDEASFASQMRDRKQNQKNNLFFGGDLDGIVKKMDHLVSLGVTALYLNPIFSSPSNHRYNTSDYHKIEAMLGGEAAFRRLIDAAHAHGIAVILDGVFNHTGDDSVYFDTHGRGDVPGAAESKDSPYYPWFHFESYPDRYESWWGIRTLPRVMSDGEEYKQFVFGEDGIVRRYLRMGADGWRLDVADELSDEFLAELRTAARAEKKDALVLGEVWEDATTKISYGKRRAYLCGRELDSVMNYPIRSAILEYLSRGDALLMRRALTHIYGNYPTPAVNALWNLLGTHDTPRALTVLSGEDEDAIPYEARAGYRMSEEKKKLATARMRLAVTMQMTLPGVPCIYYGDEAEAEGFRDPFCRMPLSWERTENTICRLYRKLGALRKREPLLATGEFALIYIDAEVLCYERRGETETLVVFLNRSTEPYAFYAPDGAEMLIGKPNPRPMEALVARIRTGTEYSFYPIKEMTE